MGVMPATIPTVQIGSARADRMQAVPARASVAEIQARAVQMAVEGRGVSAIKDVRVAPTRAVPVPNSLDHVLL